MISEVPWDKFVLLFILGFDETDLAWLDLNNYPIFIYLNNLFVFSGT